MAVIVVKSEFMFRSVFFGNIFRSHSSALFRFILRDFCRHGRRVPNVVVSQYNDYKDHITKHKQKARAQTRGLIRLGSFDTPLIVSVKAGGCGCCPEIIGHQNLKNVIAF